MTAAELEKLEALALRVTQEKQESDDALQLARGCLELLREVRRLEIAVTKERDACVEVARRALAQVSESQYSVEKAHYFDAIDDLIDRLVARGR